MSYHVSRCGEIATITKVLFLMLSIFHLRRGRFVILASLYAKIIIFTHNATEMTPYSVTYSTFRDEKWLKVNGFEKIHVNLAQVESYILA